MDKILRPERFDAVPSTTGADKAWTHWKRTFDGFLSSITSLTPPATTPAGGGTSTTGTEDPAVAIDKKKLDILINYISSEVYEYIAECTDYTTAMAALESMYIVPKNEIFARHLLATRKQELSI